MASETPSSPPPARPAGGANGAERAAKRERSGGLDRTAGTVAQRRARALKKVHWSLEQAVVGLTFLGGLPAALALTWIVWGQNYSFEVRWTLAAVVIVVWASCAIAAHQMVTRVLYLAANLLGALHEGDYSIRGTGAKPGRAADLVMKEINSLGDTLQRSEEHTSELQ